MDSRPWALLVTRNFPPLVGGMEKLNRHLLEALAAEWRVSICGPRGCEDFVPRGTVARSARIKPLPVFLALAAMKSIRLALRIRPRVVIAGSGLTAPLAWLAAKLAGARLAVYLHGLDIIAPSRIYQRLWLPFIRSADLVWVNSANTSRLAQARGVESGRIGILHPGTDIPTLDPSASAAFRSQFDLEGRAILLSVGRLTRRKGLVEFVAKSLPGIVSRQPNSVLVVIGGDASDALHGGGGGERERIAETARAAGVEGNLRFLGLCDAMTLGQAYQAAECHVFPVLEIPGDVEGFGMVALESAAHGLPTVAFDVGGVADAVAEGQTGILVRAGDYAGFSNAVTGILATPPAASRLDSCREFAGGKSWARFADRLLARLRADA